MVVKVSNGFEEFPFERNLKHLEISYYNDIFQGDDNVLDVFCTIIHRLENLRSFKGNPVPQVEKMKEWVETHFVRARENKCLRQLESLEVCLHNVLFLHWFSEEKGNFFPHLKRLILENPNNYYYNDKLRLGDGEGDVENSFDNIWKTLAKISLPSSLQTLQIPSEAKCKESSLKFLSNLTNLRHLKLGAYSNFYDEEEQDFVERITFDPYFTGYEHITSLQSLRVFEFGRNKQYGEDEFKKVCGKDDAWQIISKLTSLNCLNFKGHHEVNDSFVKSVSSLPNLTHLDIRSCYGLKDISYLSSLRQLQFLDCSENELEKMILSSPSLKYFSCGPNAAKMFESCEKLEFPSLQVLKVEMDETFTEKAAKMIWTQIASLVHFHAICCNYNVEWLQSIFYPKKLKSVFLSGCKTVVEHVEKSKLLQSDVVEKSICMQCTQPECTRPVLQPILSDFKEYTQKFFDEMKEKILSIPQKVVDSVKDFIEANKDFSPKDFQKNFALKFKDNPLRKNLFEVQAKLKKDPSLFDEELHKIVFKDLRGAISERWASMKKTFLGDSKLLDFIPVKFHKLFLSLDKFLHPLWRIEFNTRGLFLERNASSQLSAVCLLIILNERLKINFPRRLVHYILNFAK